MAKKIDIEEMKKDVKALVAGIAEVPVEDLKDDAAFTEDLGIDSMMALEIVASIEKKYKVVIPEDKIPTVRSLQNVYELLGELLKK
jgi:acyl carrier protein